MCDRIIVLIDMDCFYCQVEETLNPAIKGKPIAVVQYNAWRGGGIIAVNYPARAKGVKRGMRGDEAQAKCPDIALARVPNKNQKADTSRYREAGKRVADVLQTFTQLLERASVDEAYLDITENVNKWITNEKRKVTKELLFNTFAVGYDDITQFLECIYPEDETLANEQSLRLAVGACIANNIRSAVLEKTGYECSAGIAHNKTLAKLICGLNKPNKQTLLPHEKVPVLYETLPVSKIRSLGGKFGEHVCNTLNIQYMSELLPYSEKQLQNKFNEKYACWLYNIARGFDSEPVVQRLTSKSIGCCKNFPGRASITTVASLKHWLHELANEISERLEKDEIENSRRAKQLTVNFSLEINKQDTSNSRSIKLVSYDADQITAQSLEVVCSFPNILDKNVTDTILLPIKHLGLHAGKFEGKNENGPSIATFFNKVNHRKSKDNNEKCIPNEENTSKTIEQAYRQDENNEIKSVFKNNQTAENINESKEHSIKEIKNDELTANNKDEDTKARNIIDISSSSFFFKCYQENTQANNMITAKPTTVDSEKPGCSKINKIDLQIPQANTSFHSDDSYSSTNELECILKESNFNDDFGPKVVDSSLGSNRNCKTSYIDDYELALKLSREDICNKMQKCDECGRDVLDIVTHMDHHLALKISQQQREEFRMQQKQHFVSTPAKNATKKRRISTNEIKNNGKKTKSITSFFNKS